MGVEDRENLQQTIAEFIEAAQRSNKVIEIMSERAADGFRGYEKAALPMGFVERKNQNGPR